MFLRKLCLYLVIFLGSLNCRIFSGIQNRDCLEIIENYFNDVYNYVIFQNRVFRLSDFTYSEREIITENILKSLNDDLNIFHENVRKELDEENKRKLRSKKINIAGSSLILPAGAFFVYAALKFAIYNPSIISNFLISIFKEKVKNAVNIKQDEISISFNKSQNPLRYDEEKIGKYTAIPGVFGGSILLGNSLYDYFRNNLYLEKQESLNTNLNENLRKKIDEEVIKYLNSKLA